MATCSLAELLADANSNGFNGISQEMAGAVTLQLVSQITGNTLTVGELISQACENKFACVGPTMGMSILLQQVCNQFGIEPIVPVECTNLIPEGSVYNEFGAFGYFGLDANATYTLVFGANEVEFRNSDGNPPTIMNDGSGDTFDFTTSPVTPLIQFLGGTPGLPVTAIVCAT